MHPIQKRFDTCDSFQCGFCAGGFVMSMYTLLRNEAKPKMQDIEEALDGNVCRCTGYRPISAALGAYATDMPAIATHGDPFWKIEDEHLFDPAQEPAPPAEVLRAPLAAVALEHVDMSQSFGAERFAVYRPTEAAELGRILAAHANPILVGGGSFVNIPRRRFDTADADCIVMTGAVAEMRRIERDAETLNVGAAVTLTELHAFLKKMDAPAANALRTLIPKIATTQIRNVATLAGALLSSHSWSDMIPALSVLGTTLRALNPATGEVREVEMASLFWAPGTEPAAGLFGTHGGEPLAGLKRHPILHPGEVLFAASIPLNKPSLFASFQRKARQRANTPPLMTVSVGAEKLGKASAESFRFSVTVGCISDVPSTEAPSYAHFAADSAIGRTLADIFSGAAPRSQKLFSAASALGDVVRDLFPEDPRTLRHATDRVHLKERRDSAFALALSALTSAVMCAWGDIEVTEDLEAIVAWDKRHRGLPVTLRTFPLPPDDILESEAPATAAPAAADEDKEKLWECIVGKMPPMEHASSFKYTHRSSLQENSVSKITGDVRYPSDCTAAGLIYASFVHSTVPLGKIESISTALAETVPGFIGFFSVKDLPEGASNTHTGIPPNDTLVFADGIVTYLYQPVGVVVAETHDGAKKAARLVEVKYSELETNPQGKPVCMTIRDAMAVDSYQQFCGIGDRVITLGDDIDKALAASPVVIEGELDLGGQDHMYLETHTCTIIPSDNDRFDVYTSTQNPSKVQLDVSKNICVPASKIRCVVNQIGGGYGGKQDRPCVLATAAALPAHLLKRPVFMQLERGPDMKFSGGRHPYYVKYRAGFDRSGKYRALDLLLVNDGGGSFDVSVAVLDKSIFQSPSTYTIPNMRVEGRAVMTNRPTNTAFRGFGAPQTTQTQEMIMDHAARELGLPGHVLRDMNLNKEGDLMITGTYSSTRHAEGIPRLLWDRCFRTSEFARRYEEVQEFNRTHRVLKRGIAIIPLKNSVNFEEDFMNQASAVVHVYSDGTVRVCHSGSEMGQGLHTKMRMIAADALEVDMKYVHVAATDTIVCPNTQPTAASSGTDINGRAVRNACLKLKEYLRPVREANPDASFPEIANTAYFSRVQLTAQSFSTLPKFGWDWDEKTGFTGFYYGYGVGVGEVELNVLTGEYRVLRADLLEDTGSSLNPTTDCGQVEGGFQQGLGWLTTEEVRFDTPDLGGDGDFVDASALCYGVHTISDVPLELRTAIMDGLQERHNVHGSKASAEAPVLLATAVYLAIKEAIAAARADRGLGVGPFNVPAPLTFSAAKAALGDVSAADLAAALGEE